MANSPAIKLSAELSLNRSQIQSEGTRVAQILSNQIGKELKVDLKIDGANGSAKLLVKTLDGLRTIGIDLSKTWGKSTNEVIDVFNNLNTEIYHTAARIKDVEKSFSSLSGRAQSLFGDLVPADVTSKLDALQRTLGALKSGGALDPVTSQTATAQVDQLTKLLDARQRDIEAAQAQAAAEEEASARQKSAMSSLYEAAYSVASTNKDVISNNEVLRASFSELFTAIMDGGYNSYTLYEQLSNLSAATRDAAAAAQEQATAEAQRNAIEEAQITAAAQRKAATDALVQQAIQLAAAHRETITSSEELTRKFREFFQSANSGITFLTGFEVQFNRLNSTMGDADALHTIDVLRKEFSGNPAALRAFNELGLTIDDVKNKTDKFTTGVSDLRSYMKMTVPVTDTLADAIDNMSLRIVSIQTVVRLLKRIPSEIKKIYNEVKTIDTSMAQLQIVTGMNKYQAAEQFDIAAEAAQRTRSAINDLIDSQTVYARLGFTADESAKLAETTAQLQKVGNVAIEDAQDAVTSIIKAYGKNVDELSRVMDEMVMIGNNFPISASELAKAMGNAGSALSVAGNTVEESMALLMAANSAVQDASKSSTGMRTIIARLRDNTAELDALGELDVEFKYGEILSAVGKAGVELKDTNGELRSSYDILRDLSIAWKDMGTEEQAALTKALAGTRQTNVFASLMNNFASAQKALAATADAEGTMAESYEVYTQSIEGYAAKLNATYQEFAKNFLNDDIIKRTLTFADGLLKVANALSKWNMFLPTIMLSLTRLGGRTGANGALYSPLLGMLGYGVGNVDNTYAHLAKISTGYRGSASNIVTTISDFNAAVGPERTKIVENTAQSYGQLSTYLNKVANSADGAKASVQGFYSSIGGNVLKSIGSAFASAGINLAIGLIITALIKLGDKLIVTKKEFIELGEQATSTMQEVAAKTNDNVKTLSSIADEYARLAQGVNQYNNQNQSLDDEEYQRYLDYANQIAGIAPELVRYYDAQGNAVLNLAGNENDLTAAIQKQIKTIQNLANVEMAKNGRDIFNGIRASLADTTDDIKILLGVLDVVSGDVPDYEQFGGYDAFEARANTVLQDMGYTYHDIVTGAADETEAAIGVIEARIEDLQDSTNQEFAPLRQALSAWVNSDDQFLTLEDNTREAVLNALSGINFGALISNGYQYDDIQQLIRDLGTTLDDNQDVLTRYIDIQTLLNGGECTVEEYRKAVAEFIGLLDGIPDEQRKAILLSIGYDEETGDILGFSDAVSKISEATGSRSSSVERILGLMSPDEVDDFVDYVEDRVADGSEASAYKLWKDYKDVKQDIESEPVEVKFDGEMGTLSNEFKYIDKLQKELAQDGKMSFDTMAEAPERMQQVVEDYKLGLISANDVLKSSEQIYIQDATVFAAQEMAKSIQAGNSAADATNAWNNALSSLGVSYGANGKNFANMLNGMLGSNASAVNLFLSQWDGAFGSVDKTLAQIINDTTSAIKRIQTQTAKVTQTVVGYKNGKAITVATSGYSKANTAELNKLYTQLSGLRQMQIAAANFSYTPISGGSVSYGGGSSGGGGGGSSSSASDAIGDAYKSAVDALKSEAEWYEYQAEQYDKIMDTSASSENWKKAVALYRSMADTAQQEIQRLANSGLSFGDDAYDSAIKDFEYATDAIEEIFSNMVDNLTEQYEDYIDVLDGMDLFGAQNGYQLDLIRRELKQIDDAYAHSLLTTEDYVKRKTDVMEEYYDAYMDYISAVSDAIDRSIEQEKKALSEQQDSIEKTRDQYDTVIDVITEMIDKRIDSMNEENDELERQQKLEQALLDLERARNSGTNRIYREGRGFDWEVDADAIREAQKAYDDLSKEYADDEIVKSLNSVKDALADIQNAYQNAKNNQTVADLFGDNWDEDLSAALDVLVAGGEDSERILQQMLADIAAFEPQYSDLNRALDEDVEGSVANQLESLDKLADAWSEFADSVDDESSQYEGLLDYIKEFESANYEERMAMLEEFSKFSVEQLEAIRAKAGDVVDAFDIVKNNQNISDVLGMNTQQSGQSSGQTQSGGTQTQQTSQWDNLASLGNVYYGSSSSAIRQLQEALIAAGYGSYMSGYGADGQFGPKTLAAVKAFQSASGLSVDGIAGINTLTALRKKLRGYRDGGVIDYTGLAMVHGGQRPEIALANQDVAKIYQYIHETPNLITDLVNNRLPRSAFVGRGAVNGRVINVTVGDLYEVNDAAELARDIEMRLPNLLEQKMFN